MGVNGRGDDRDGQTPAVFGARSDEVPNLRAFSLRDTKGAEFALLESAAQPPLVRRPSEVVTRN